MSRRALRRYLSIVAMLLSVVMLIFSSPLGALATGTDGSEINEKIDVNDTGLSDQQANTSAQAGDGAETVNSAAAITLQQGEKTLEELSAMTVDLATIPECIDPAAALEKGHVNRLSLQEKSSNTVIYQNINGTKTTYIFSKPVKYIDTDGTVKDKSSAVTAVLDNTYSYAMQSNSVKVYFPKTSSAGTLLTYGEYSVSMSPKGDMTAQPSYDSESGKVIYPYVFGMNTLLVYDTQTDGLKEDIVVAKNIGVNEFDFEMTLSGLVPYKENGIWYLKNAQDETVGSLGQIIVNDSAGNRAIGEMTVTATDVSGKYDVTVIAPESFMNADSTVYPVYVDPSVTIYEDGYYTYLDEWGDPVYVDYDAIVDIGLYSEEYGATYHQEEYDHHTIGYAVGGEGRIVYRLYDFYGEYGQYKDIPYTQIGSVELHAEVYPPQTYEDESDALITVNPMNVLGVDDNSNAVYNEEMLNGYSTWNQSTSLINVYSTELVVDITDIARGWARYNAGESVKSYDNPANGFVVRCDTDASHTIYSLEASGSSNVYVVVDTSVFGGGHYIMANMEDVFLNLSGGTGINVSETTTPETVKWYIDYQGSDDYIIRSFTDPNICLRKNGYYPAAGDITTVDISQYIWNIEYSSYSGVIISSPDGYKLCYTPTDGIYLDNSSESPISTWGLITISDYHTIQSAGITTFPYLEEGSNTYLEIVCSPANSYWSWEECFNWSSSSTAVATVDSDGRVWAHSPGTTTITAVHKIWDISCEIDIKVCTVFKDDEGETIQSFTTLVINNKTRGFLSTRDNPTETQSALMQIKQGELDAQEWVFIRTTSGYYIKFKETNKYVCLNENNNDPNILKLRFTDMVSDASIWNLYENSDNAYRIVTASAPNDFCLSISKLTDANEADCVLQLYGDANKKFNEWLLGTGKINDVEWEYQVGNMWCWATAARMFAKNYGNITLTKEEIIQMITGGLDEDAGGDPEKARKAIGLYLGESLNTDPDNYQLKTQVSYTVMSSLQVKEYVDYGHVILASRVGQYINNPEKYNKHMVVITGYLQIGDNLMLVIKDSGNESYGPYIFRTYDGFCDDLNSHECEMEYLNDQVQPVWNGTITVTQINASQ